MSEDTRDLSQSVKQEGKLDKYYKFEKEIANGTGIEGNYSSMELKANETATYVA